MRQFLRKRALVAVLSGIALVGMSQPASAAETNPTFRAQVTPNGVGDLLIFAYWTADERDTLIAITNAFGHQNERYVHLKFHRGTDGARMRASPSVSARVMSGRPQSPQMVVKQQMPPSQLATLAAATTP